MNAAMLDDTRPGHTAYEENLMCVSECSRAYSKGNRTCQKARTHRATTGDSETGRRGGAAASLSPTSGEPARPDGTTSRKYGGVGSGPNDSKLQFSVLAVIPARGGSKSIPGKNIRLLHDKPLIAYAIQSCKSCSAISHVVVSTEDDAIAEVARHVSVEVVRRPPELAADEVPLDTVIFHATEAMKRQGRFFDIIATVQATCPFVKAETLARGLYLFEDPSVDTVITVYDNTHLMWRIGTDGHPVPLFECRQNRQLLPRMLAESGALIASRRAVINPDNRVGRSVKLLEIDRTEALDIDDHLDWSLAETLLSCHGCVARGTAREV